MKKIITGKIISDKMTNSAVVEVSRWKKHPLYEKKYIVSRNFLVHNPDNKYKVGENVEIKMCRPMSKNKNYKIVNKSK
jgi:small subunit ribosomal protein S17